jgi:carbon storage regulator
MLVLTRKPNEVINIGDQIMVRILRIQGNQVRVGIEAPPGVHILRGELERPPTERDVPPLPAEAVCDFVLEPC